MWRPSGSLALLAALFPALLAAPAVQPPAQSPPNYDEARVPPYTLPDPLVAEDGTRVTSAGQWVDRRKALLGLFATSEYGATPGPRPAVWTTRTSRVVGALDGRAIRIQVTLNFGDRPDPQAMHLLLYLPAQATAPAPVFLALNFKGNQAVSADPGIALATSWLPDTDPGVEHHRATEATRGTEASRFPLDLLLSHGYGLATAYYGDLDPDFDDGFQNGVEPLFYRPGQTRPADGEWGAIGAWAWGLSRAMDYLDTNPEVDERRVVVIGHSRLGKTALWAAAQDERFAIVISNDSGCGGAALHRRAYGETIESITRAFPHWFTSNFVRYAGHEDQLPIDQHELLALIAPRPLYVASAAEDRWADPKGEFLAAAGADPVYRLLGRPGLGVIAMPEVDHPVGDTIGYHVRTGGHDLTRYDWEQFVAFAERQFNIHKP
jgi:(4-O-methyl)-D-glucuronate---lignin esterase